MDKKVYDAVLEDVIDRIIEENGPEVATLDWRILVEVREAVGKPDDDSPQ